MNHPPKQLALLISLIGGGISPYAQARIHEHRIDLTQTMPDIACTELDAVALPVCAAPADRDLVWQPQRSALDLSTTAGVLVLYGARSDDWAPGEVKGKAEGGSPSTAAVATNEVIEAPRPQPVRVQTRKTHRVRVLAKAAVARLATFARADAHAIERIQPIEPLEPLAHSSEPIPKPAAAASAGSIEVERLLTNLATVWSKAPPAVVENQTDKVLRHLGAIRSDQRDEVGAIQPEPPRPAALSHTDKVLKTLGEFAAPSASPPAVEDGPSRRLRKLAARDAKVQAQAEARVQAQAAETGVDLLLPLDPPAAPAAPTPRTSPFGDMTVAISEHSLDRVRGGYAGEGLNISFGIERAVYINGSLATTTSLNVTDLGQITAGRGTAVLDTGTIALIQSGAGNSVAGASISASSMGTIVQNTLDGQKIQNVTVINATANSLGVFRTMNLQSSLRGAVIDSLRR